MSKNFILEKPKTHKSTEKESLSKIKLFFKANGLQGKRKSEFKRQKLAPIKDSFKLQKEMEKVNSFGKMVSTIQGNGLMAKKMEVDIGNLPNKKVIWDNGIMVKFLVLAYIWWKMAKDMKDNLRIFLNMVSVKKSFLMEIGILGNMS